MTAQSDQSLKTNAPSPCERPSPLILCVDDDPEITRMIELRLGSFEVRVMRAYFGVQGIWNATRELPDLIIMDLAMPSGDGQYMLDCLKRNRRTACIPVIVLTGMRDRKLHQRMFEFGAASLLCKPVRFVDLLREIGRFVHLRARESASNPSQTSTADGARDEQE